MLVDGKMLGRAGGMPTHHCSTLGMHTEASTAPAWCLHCSGWAALLPICSPASLQPATPSWHQQFKPALVNNFAEDAGHYDARLQQYNGAGST